MNQVLQDLHVIRAYLLEDVEVDLWRCSWMLKSPLLPEWQNLDQNCSGLTKCWAMAWTISKFIAFADNSWLKTVLLWSLSQMSGTYSTTGYPFLKVQVTTLRSAGNNTQIVMNVTKCSTAAVNKHSIGVNILGSKVVPLSYSSTTWIWGSTHWGLTSHAEGLARSFSCEGCYGCECCQSIANLLSNPFVKCALRCPCCNTGKHELTISHWWSDNSRSFQILMENVLCIKGDSIAPS